MKRPVTTIMPFDPLLAPEFGAATAGAAARSSGLVLGGLLCAWAVEASAHPITIADAVLMIARTPFE